MHVEIDRIAFGYTNEASVLKDISFSLKSGSIAAILGDSGSGKSTLLRILSGLEAPKSGAVRVEGTPWVDRTHTLPPQKRPVGMVFQAYALFPHLTVGKNIAFGLKGLTRDEKAKRVTSMLELVGLTHKQGSFPHELSGGQRQRVALARALAPEPKILLLDEPFSNLDETLKDSIRTDLKRILKASGTTTILVTHDRRDAEALTHDIYSLEDGILHKSQKK